MGCLILNETYYQNPLKVVYKGKPKASREAKSELMWLSVDPIALYDPIDEVEHYLDGQHNGGYFNPANLSVYGYTYQNPILYVDPNGKQGVAGAIWGGLKGASKNVFSQIVDFGIRHFITNGTTDGLQRSFNENFELDKKDLFLETTEGALKGGSGLGILTDGIKAMKIVKNSLDDAKIDFFDSKSKDEISLSNIFDKGNESYLKDFGTSLVKNFIKEFVTDMDKLGLDGGGLSEQVFDEIFKFSYEKVNGVLLEVFDDIIDHTIGGNNNIQQNGN